VAQYFQHGASAGLTLFHELDQLRSRDEICATRFQRSNRRIVRTVSQYGIQTQNVAGLRDTQHYDPSFTRRNRNRGSARP
jgi:hypothetical protein